jgi:hypothetical protein
LDIFRIFIVINEISKTFEIKYRNIRGLPVDGAGEGEGEPRTQAAHIAKIIFWPRYAAYKANDYSTSVVAESRARSDEAFRPPCLASHPTANSPTRSTHYFVSISPCIIKYTPYITSRRRFLCDGPSRGMLVRLLSSPVKRVADCLRPTKKWVSIGPSFITSSTS